MEVLVLLVSFLTISSGSCSLLNFMIIGGRYAEENEFPYQVGFKIPITGASRLPFTFCGGSIISDEWIISAAHCFTRWNSEQIEKMQVVVGTNNLLSPNLVLTGLNATIHPEYNETTNLHPDLALIHVKGGGLIQRKDKWYSKAITVDSDSDINRTNTIATVSGYGSFWRTVRLPSLYLRTTQFKILPGKKCSHIYGRKDFDPTSGVDLCVGDLEGKTGSCSGDSGGPLVVTQGNQELLVGVVSRGDSCAKKNVPKIYVHVSSFISWIQDVTGLSFRETV